MEDTVRQLVKQYFKNDTFDSIEYQKDGLTNQNYIVFRDNEKYAVRISGETAHYLGINRHAELASMKAAADIGVGAEIVYFSTETGNMITKYIHGTKWTNQDAATPENIKRIAETLKKVHRLPPIPYEFSPYKDIEDRIHFANRHDLGLPDYLDRLLDKLHSIKRQREEKKTEYAGLCHNDPFPNNFIDDGNVRLIDWEYGGMGDIFFDISSVCAFYSPSQKEDFLQHYFGQCDRDKLVMLDQMSFVSTFWNCMWAVVQMKMAKAKHDYQSMAGHMFSQLNEALHK